MGAKVTSIRINDFMYYEGQVKANIPDGKGRLSIAQQNGSQNSWDVLGQFENGQLVQCIATHMNMVYEGPVSDGVFCGNAKAKNKQNEIQYEGKFQNGILVSGKINRKNMYSAKCDFTQNNDKKICSQKKHEDYNKIILKLNGIGQFQWAQFQEKVSGQFKDGQVQGKGAYYFSNGDQYFGNFANGYFESFGHYIMNDKMAIKQIFGYFKQSKCTSKKKKNEIHKIVFRNGDIYEGQMHNNKMHCKMATYQFNDGSVYKGSIYHNQLTGSCEISYGKDSHLLKYSGQVLKGLYNGLGVLEYKNGVILKGFFLGNKINGPSIIIYGEVLWKCLYVMDQLVESVQLIQKNQQI